MTARKKRLIKLPKAEPSERKRRPMQSWNYRFGQWLVEQAFPPSRKEQVEAATKLANAKLAEGATPVVLNYSTIARLKRREDWQEFVKTLEKRGMEAARAIFLKDAALYAESGTWALETAVAKEDYKAVAGMVLPVWDRAVPKKDERAAQAPQIIINLGGAFARMVVDAPPQEVEVIELPALRDAELVEDNETPAVADYMRPARIESPKNEDGEVIIPVQGLVGAKRLSITPGMRRD